MENIFKNLTKELNKFSYELEFISEFDLAHDFFHFHTNPIHADFINSRVWAWFLHPLRFHFIAQKYQFELKIIQLVSEIKTLRLIRLEFSFKQKSI